MKRPVDEDQPEATASHSKRIKIEGEAVDDLQIVENVVEEEREDWKPTQVILSSEAYSVSYFHFPIFKY